MTTKTLIGILLIMLYMGVMLVLDIKDKKRRAGLFDNEKDFDKQLNLLYDVASQGILYNKDIKKSGLKACCARYY